MKKPATTDKAAVGENPNGKRVVDHAGTFW
jgi:hypothetical protein